MKFDDYDSIKELELQNVLKVIGDLVNRKVQTLQSLHRHLTMLSSTLLGILAVFGRKELSTPLFHCLITFGATALFLCLLSGIYCLWQYYKLLDKAGKMQAENYRQRGKVRAEFVEHPKIFEHIAKFCPISFCVGVLFLLVAILLR